MLTLIYAGEQKINMPIVRSAGNDKNYDRLAASVAAGTHYLDIRPGVSDANWRDINRRGYLRSNEVIRCKKRTK